MRKEDRDQLAESLKETLSLPWKVELIGPGTDLHGPGLFRENGLQVVNDRRDIVRLIGIQKTVKRADRIMKVFVGGKYQSHLEGGPFRGRGWQQRALCAFAVAIREIDKTNGVSGS
jgi:hypothetical protein|tara:strand:- start:3515 stop:3862 length:348 start_codon:yes stop_codon:yes gene_type:complete